MLWVLGREVGGERAELGCLRFQDEEEDCSVKGEHARAALGGVIYSPTMASGSLRSWV